MSVPSPESSLRNSRTISALRLNDEPVSVVAPLRSTIMLSAEPVSRMAPPNPATIAITITNTATTRAMRCAGRPPAPEPAVGSVATLKTLTEDAPSGTGREVSGSHIEQLVDELILFANIIIVADPPRLPLPDHVHRLVSLNRSPGGLELAKAPLGFDSPFDRSMILLHDVVQVLDRSMSAAAAQGAFLFHSRNRRAVEAGLISVDDAGLRMRWDTSRALAATRNIFSRI